MEKIIETAIYEGVDVDLLFKGDQPMFGDLFQICGYTHPQFLASGKFDFISLSKFDFEQVDDLIGIKSNSDKGDDVVVWLYSMVGSEVVFHHPGPFTSIRLSFNVLRNTTDQVGLFLQIVERFAQTLPVNLVYRLRNLELSSPFDLSVMRADIEQIIEHWRSEDIEPGSSEALQLSY